MDSKISVVYRVDGEDYDSMNDQSDFDKYIRYRIASEISHTVANAVRLEVKRRPKPPQEISVANPSVYNFIPYTPVDLEYKAELYVFSPEELDEFVKDVEKQTRKNLAADRAMHTSKYAANC